MQLKTLLSILAITVMLSFTACSSSNQKDLTAGTSAAEKSSQNKNSSAGSASGGTASEELVPQEKSAANTPNLSVLSDSIQNLEQRIDSTTPGDSAQEQKEQFLLLKNEIDALEHELDYAEDNLESQYRSGSLEISSYQEQEQEIESLEDRLDHCEDQLEFLFQMDDSYTIS